MTCTRSGHASLEARLPHRHVSSAGESSRNEEAAGAAPTVGAGRVWTSVSARCSPIHVATIVYPQSCSTRRTLDNAVWTDAGNPDHVHMAISVAGCCGDLGYLTTVAQISCTLRRVHIHAYSIRTVRILCTVYGWSMPAPHRTEHWAHELEVCSCMQECTSAPCS